MRELAAATTQEPYFEGAPLYVYGHSWTEYPNPYSTPYTGEYQSRTAARLRLGNVTNQGFPGAKLPEVLAAAVCPTYRDKDRRFTPGTMGLVLLHALVNDIATSNSTADDPLYQETYRHNLRSFLAWVSAASYQSASGAVTTGVWTDAGASTAALYPGGAMKVTSQDGATMDFTVTGDEAWVWCVVNDPGLATGAWAASVNGKQLTAWNPTGKVKGFTNTLGQFKRDMAVAVKITGMSAAAGTADAKTLTITRTPGTPNTYVAGVSQRSATPPRVYIAKEAPYNPFVNATARNKFLDRSPVYNRIIDEVAAEFPNAHTVDFSEGWEHAAMYSQKDTAHVHPNDLGMVRLATTLCQRIRETITAPDPGVLVL